MYFQSLLTNNSTNILVNTQMFKGYDQNYIMSEEKLRLAEKFQAHFAFI